jgi:hypothetical protein
LVDERIDLARNEFLQAAADFVMVGGEQHFCRLPPGALSV